MGDMVAKKAEKEAKTKKSAADMAKAQQDYNQMAQQGTSLLGQLFNWNRSNQQEAQKAEAGRRYYDAKGEFDVASKELRELTEQVGEIAEKWKTKAFEDLKEIKLAAKKSDVKVVNFGIAWVPYWKVGERLIAAFAKL
jgi:acyl-homoserine lactone acylase PvdQ